MGSLAGRALGLALLLALVPLTGCFSLQDTPLEQRGVPGGLTLACLDGSTYTRMVVEIDHASGHRPEDSTIQLIRQRLVDVCDKPDGITVEVELTDFELSDGWTADDIRAEGLRTRAAAPRDGDTLRWHLLFPAGHHASDGVLGQAVNAATVAVFQATIQDAENLLQRPSWEQMEGSVAVHEVGHLLGLVNLVYTSPRAHEDGSHPGHSNNDESVMYWAVETADIGNVLSGEVPDAFDADDLADLEDLASGAITARDQLWTP